MSFTILNSDIFLCSADNIIVYNWQSGKESNIELPKLIIDKDIKFHNNNDTGTCHGITSVTISKDNEYFCVCTNRKQLCLYTKDCTLVSNRTLVRAASQVRFTPNNDIVVADKSGDVYLYHTCKEENGTLILGHLSMLLDILVTPDNKYVITADRDEKIRVSQFPNAYNIESYCLGHTNFVTNILLLPHDQNILVSAGGDGTVKFWDYKHGKELHSINYSEIITSDEVKQLNVSLQDLELSEMVATLPVKHLRMMQLDVNTSILAITCYGSSKILLFNITGHSSELNADLNQTLVENVEPLECIFKEHLWVLNDYGLTSYKVEKSRFVKNLLLNEKLQKLIDSWSSLRSKISAPSFYPILYKRKFDTVQEYQERKKSRVMNVME